MNHAEGMALLRLRKRFLKKAVDCERLALRNRPDANGVQVDGDEQYKRSLYAEAGRWAWLEAEGMLRDLMATLEKKK